MKKKILILGGYGFMGKNLNNIFSIDNNYIIYNESRRTGCDITNYNELKNKLVTINPNIIINAAAHVGSISYVSKYAANVCHDNSLMYLNIFKAINEFNPNIVFINPISNCSYPGVIDIQNEELWWDGVIHDTVESYGNPKKLGFILSECYRKQYGIKTVNLILPNAYGPFDYTDELRTHAMNGIILRMLRSIKNLDKIFTIWGSGNPIREWIYMEDAAKIIKQIVDKNMFSLPNPLNIAQKFGVSINESVDTIRNLLNSKIDLYQDLSKPDGAQVKILGDKLFRIHFPDFQFTDYKNGIKNTIEYYKNKI